MTLTKLSLSNPVAVVVACILVAIFGVLSLMRLPIQMAPEISRPEITVYTGWRASSQGAMWCAARPDSWKAASGFCRPTLDKRLRPDKRGAWK